MKICVLNCSNPTPELLRHESDSYVDYRMGRSSCFMNDKCTKHCRSWHSWPYALETEFFVYLKDKWQDVYKYDAVIILVNRDIQQVLPLVKKLKAMRKKVAVSFHEGCQDLIGGSGLSNEDLPKRWIELTELVKESDFYINLFGQMTPFFEGWFGKNKVKYCNHGAPFDWKHNLAKKWEDRTCDILIGTRTLNQRLSRNTLVSLAILNGFSKKYGWNVHYLSEDGDVSSLLKKMNLENIKVHQGPMKWEDWLKFLSNFKCVVMADNSLNLGQIVYDCVMMDVNCIGSTTWNSMQLECDDDADYRNWEYDIEHYGLSKEYYKQNWFIEEHHPDKIKENLLKLFQ